jgi:hypothetical protein
MADPKDYEVGTAALAVVIQAAIKANVPDFLMGQVKSRQAMIYHIEQQGAKAVIDAVDAARASVNQSK